MDPAPVLLAHPGVQHSRELAKALHAGGLLALFATAVDGRIGGGWEWPARWAWALRQRAVDGVPPERVSTLPWIELLPLAARWVAGRAAEQAIAFAMADRFDRRVARLVASRAPRVVVGVEGSCRRTFRAARAAGAWTVLDAASLHHLAQPRPAGRPSARDAELVRRKDEELALADRVVVLSRHAKATYARAGIAEERIAVIPPGVWQPQASGDSPRDRGSHGVRFLFVGNLSHVKGIDVLLEAYARLEAPGAELRMIGDPVDADLLAGDLPPGVVHVPRQPRGALFGEYARADVLVLPSRGDGFGLVVAEAMQCGLPVIVSTATGAADVVAPGASGWIVPPGDADALARAMADACSRRDALPGMGARARQAIAHLTWDAYGERVRAFYRELASRPREATL